MAPDTRHIKDFFQSFDWVVGEIFSWRMRAKLAIRKTGMGLFRKNSHEVIEIPLCQTHHPSINQAAELLKKNRFDPYDEETGSGTFRYAQFFVCRESKKVQLTLVIQKDLEAAKRLAKDLWGQSDLWHSIWINEQPLLINRIFGDKWIHCFGPEFLHQRIGKAIVPFHPAAFAQANLNLFDRILERVEQWVKPNSHLLEIYAGVGAISMHLKPLLQSALLIEDNPYAFLSFQQTSCSYRYLQADAKAAIAHLGSFDVILVDPPRKGLDPELLKALCCQEDKTLIYISCNFESFKRDAERLLQAGWQIGDAAGFELFPGTDHVELAVCFVR